MKVPLKSAKSTCLLPIFAAEIINLGSTFQSFGEQRNKKEKELGLKRTECHCRQRTN